MEHDSRTVRWEQRVAYPLGLASLLYLGAYALWILGEDLPEPVPDLCLIAMGVTWAMFLVDYAVRWRLSGQGPGFVRHHPLDTLVALLPLMRPVRVARVYDALQQRHHGQPGLPVPARVILYAGLSAVLLGFAASLSVYRFERHAPGATIHTFGDSLWWAASTLSTVGYGDVAPITLPGRLVAVVLMGCGLALLGAVTGSFSSYLMQRFSQADDRRRPPGDSPGA